MAMNLEFDGLSKNIPQIIIFEILILEKDSRFEIKKERVFGFLHISISFQLIKAVQYLLKHPVYIYRVPVTIFEIKL